MKKHIVGFIIFNFIVGTSLIVAAFFYQKPKFESVVITPVTSETYTRSCWKSKSRFINNTTSARVTQAIFDSKAQELKTELFVQADDEKSLKTTKVALHFFVKDGNSTRYLATEDLKDEKVSMKGTFDSSESRAAKVTFLINSSYQWLDDLKSPSRDNLYVVPQIITNNSYHDYKPVFDEMNATPVTIAH